MNAETILGWAEHYQAKAEEHTPEHPLFARYWRRSDLLYKLHYWLRLPWPCRYGGHAEAVERTTWNADVHCVEEAWLECPRCQHWMGWSERDPLGRGRP